MKKSWIVLAALLFYSSFLEALSVGNPIEPWLLSERVDFPLTTDPQGFSLLHRLEPYSVALRMGFYGDYVFERHLEIAATGETIHQTRVMTNAGLIAIDVFRRIEFFTTLGATRIFIRTPGRVFGSPANDYTLLETETGFSWSVGGRWAFAECYNWGLGIEGQYFSTRPSIDYAQDEGNVVSYSAQPFRYREYQFGLGLTYTIQCSACGFMKIVPYGALKWSHVHTDANDVFVAGSNFIFDMNNDKQDWGYALGLTLVNYKRVDITAEGRFLDERAFHLNAQARF